MSVNQSSSREIGMEKYFFLASSEDFTKVPGSPIAYWVSKEFSDVFVKSEQLNNYFDPRQGMATGDNGSFVRGWYEVSQKLFEKSINSKSAAHASGSRYFPYNKGGGFKKWYGNRDDVIKFDVDSYRILKNQGNHCPSENLYFQPNIGWSKVSSGNAAFRHYEHFIFDVAGCSIFGGGEDDRGYLIGFLNSYVCRAVLSIFSPTLNFEVGAVKQLPLFNRSSLREKCSKISKEAIDLSKVDWNSYEFSWDFSSHPLLQIGHLQPTLKASYQSLRTHWREMTLDMQRLERENNRIFIEAYGMQDELTPEVPLNEITLTCNPHYRYGGDKSEEELEAMLLADTMRELVSYAVGCMLGRYSLDKPGLILANQGETLADYLAQVPQPSFPADDDNVIPMLDGDWFADDITLRFRQFLRVAFGEEHYEDNLAFIEQALNIKGKRNYGLRDYFLGEFYTDHVKRYKKRPIYWLFSSPKGSFNALIYMHRYRPDTVSVVLKYLRDYREKLVTEKERQAAVSINPASSQGEKTKALKEVDRLAKVLAELEDYERDVLYPLATEQKQINLDDGVKVNYLRFGAALKKIAGLEAKEED